MDTKLIQINSLVDKLNHHRDLYYNQAKPEVTDAEYDSLFDELKKLESETGYIRSDSPTQTVGFEVKSKLEKVEHNHPMLSLDKIHSVDEIYNFVQKHGDCVLSLKMDGLTLSLTYDENGDLVSAETRGDGKIGEQVLHNAKKVKSIPLKINNHGKRLIIDGELISFKNEFEEFNETQDEDEKYAHVRNFASGSIRLLDSSESAKRPLDFVGWKIVEGCTENSFFSRLDAGSDIGFMMVNHQWIKRDMSKDEIQKVMDYLLMWAEISFAPIDGLVLTIDDVEYGESLGLTGHHPRNSLAWKPDVETAETFIRDISWRVGKTGMMAPKAIFDTVILDGTEVSAATLHNLSYIEDMQIGIGSRVKVKKANLIIPKVVERVSEPTFYNPPSICPCCGHPVEIKETKGKDEDGNERTIKTLFCPNDNCTEKNLSKFVQFVSKAGMNIDGLGEKQIEQLINAGYIRKFSDIYRLPNYPEIALLEGWGKKSFEKMCTSIEASKNCKLENYLVALSIPNIGKSAAKIIHKHFKGNWKGFCQALVNNFDFTQLEDFGPKMATSLQEWWSDLTGLDSDLAEFVSFIVDEEKEVRVFSSDNFCNGKTFVVTGKFVKYKRSELEQIITDRGGKLSGSVSKKTNYLLTNEASGSSKYNKAMELNIPIMTEDEFISKIGE